MAEKALTTIDSINLPMLQDPDTVRAIIEENLDGMTPDFVRIKIPAGGGLAFEVPDEAGEPQAVSELVGVIVDHYAVNAYWADKYSGQGNPPDCSSRDGKTGVAPEGSNVAWAGGTNACATCPLNQWNSDPDGSGGKACKNTRRVFLLREGEILPVMLSLPPTSLRNFTAYMARLSSKLRHYTSVVTRIKLQKAQNKGGITYSQAVFSVAGQLDAETAAQIRHWAEALRPATRGLEVQADEYVNGSASANEEDPF